MFRKIISFIRYSTLLDSSLAIEYSLLEIKQLVVKIASVDLGHVVGNHVTDEAREVDGADPAKDCLRLGGIAEKLLDLGGAEVRGVHLDEDPERRRKREMGKSQKIV